MPRLFRPHIPLCVRVQVAERQFDSLPIPTSIDPEVDVLERERAVFRDFVDRTSWRLRTPSGRKLNLLLRLIFGLAKFHLDHDPALGAREKIVRHGAIVGYRPDANDPEHLFYREVESHKLKTNVRGDGAQYPDRVLIKRQRRREKVEKPRRKVASGGRWPRRTLAGAKGWPPRGSRKLTGRAKP